MTETNLLRTIGTQIPLVAQPLASAGLEDWLDESGITFVLGPGCARLDSSSPAVLASVADSMARCFNRIGVGGDAHGDEDRRLDQTFLATLAAEKQVDMTMATDPNGPIDLEHPESALDDTRIRLVHVARLASDLLAKALQSSPSPILDWDDLNLPTLALTAESRKLCTEIDGLLSVLANVRLRIQGAEGEANVDPMPGGPTWSDIDLLFGLENVDSSLKTLKFDLESHRSFGGAQVEWLSSLLWHSFRFAAPWYPSSHDMAFQLAAGRKNGIAEVPDWPLATQSDSSLTRNDILKRLLSIAREERSFDDKEGTRDRRTLYRSIASLLLQGDIRQSFTKADVLGTDRNPFKVAHDAITPPLALVSGFDNLLDEALEAELRSEDSGSRFPTYHVVLPVLLEGDADASADLGWVLGTYRTTEEGGVADGFDEGETGQASSSDTFDWELLLPLDVERELNFVGPVIVKMNGDPTCTFKPAAIDGLPARYRRVSAVAAISEFQHLSLGLTEMQLLMRLQYSNLHKGERRLVILGESLDNWSIRQRLFTQGTWPLRQNPGTSNPTLAGHVAPDSDGQNVQSSSPTDAEIRSPRIARAMAINRRNDPLRHSILSWVNIQPVIGELADVATMLTKQVEVQNEILEKMSASGDPR